LEIIPAIDIINGSCVRLFKGDYKKISQYSTDPILVAKKWESLGASWIHIIDLDGAREGKPVNFEIAFNIKKNTNLKVEYGGGIRKIEDINLLLNMGIDKIIIGTKAIEDFDFLVNATGLANNKVIVSIDFNEKGIVLKRGWLLNSDYNFYDFGEKLFKTGILEVIITDTSRDGTLKGININIIRDFIVKTNLKVYVAGGINSIEDIIKLKKIEEIGIKGAIIGKALYENKIDLKKAIEISKL
jgi:phosphoribosylformimino-5-aminoimidazole carboxamide ribotide isomerase